MTYSGGVADEQVVFTAAAGTTYYVIIDGYDGAFSAYDLAVSCAAAGTGP